MTTAGRILIAVLWLGALVYLASWSNGVAALAAAALVTVSAGALIGRWWVLTIPLVTAAYLIVGSLLTWNDGDYHFGTGLNWAACITVLASVVALLLAVGVGMARLVVRSVERHVRDVAEEQRE